MIKLPRALAGVPARVAHSISRWARRGASPFTPVDHAAEPIEPEAAFPGAKTAKLLEANEQLILRMLRAQMEAEAAARKLNKLARLAEHDALTELPNRVLLLDRLTQAIAGAKRHGGRLALLFVDLNGFKQINDNYGHGIGDEVLRLVGRRLAAAVRQADTVGRYGGDEFLVLLSEVSQASDASLIADKLAAALAEPSRIGDHVFHLSAGIGIGIYPDDSLDPDELIAIADAAMYVAKRQGVGNQDNHVVHTREQPDATSLPPQLTRYELALAKYEERHDRLQAANELLSRALERAERLQAAAEYAQRRQTEFMAVLAQEIFTPIAPVCAPAQALESDLARGAREEEAARTAVDKHNVEMTDVIEKAVIACKPVLVARQQHLSVAIPPRPLGVLGDPVRLARSFRGLLENASRSAQMGGEIAVSAAVADDALHVTIVDNGQATDAHSPQTVLEPILNGRHPADENDGQGLTLALVRRLVEEHGGQLVARGGSTGYGSEFVVTLPLAGVDPESAGARTWQHAGGTGTAGPT